MDGPSFTEPEIPARATYTWTKKRVETTKYVSTFESSLKRTVSTKTTTEVSSKIGSEIGLGATGLTPKLQSELQSKVSSELLQTAESELGQTNSYEVQNSEEIQSSLSLAPNGKAPGVDKLILYFFLKLWPWRFNVYLHKIEYLQLEYKREWLWWQVRNTILTRELSPRQPLYQIVYYEPDDWPSLRENSYEPQVSDISLSVLPLKPNGYPKVSDPGTTSLEDLARLAFPVSKAEKEKAKARKKVDGSKKAAKKGWAYPTSRKRNKTTGGKGSTKTTAKSTARKG
jgi:hypothetical protein